MSTNKDQLNALISATMQKYDTQSIRAALRAIPFPGPLLTDVEELTNLYRSFMNSFSPQLFWQLMNEKGLVDVETAGAIVGDIGINADWQEVAYVSIVGRYELKVISKDSWEATMITDGHINVHFNYEVVEKRVKGFHLEPGAKVTKNGDSLLISTPRHPDPQWIYDLVWEAIRMPK